MSLLCEEYFTMSPGLAHAQHEAHHHHELLQQCFPKDSSIHGKEGLLGDVRATLDGNHVEPSTRSFLSLSGQETCSYQTQGEEKDERTAIRSVVEALGQAIFLSSDGVMREVETGQTSVADALEMFHESVTDAQGPFGVTHLDGAARLAWAYRYPTGDDLVAVQQQPYDRLLSAWWWSNPRGTCVPSTSERDSLASLAGVSKTYVDKYFMRRRLLTYRNLADAVSTPGCEEVKFVALVFDQLVAATGEP